MLTRRTVDGTTALMAALLLAAHGATCAQGSTPGIVKWDDYTFKFTPSGQMAQVFDSQGKLVGSILAMNGDLQLMPLPGTDSAKLTQSFADWKVFNARAHGGSPSTGGASTQASAVCNLTQGASYLSDSGWKPLTLVDVQHGRGASLSGGLRDLAHNPFNPRAGQTNIVTLTNPSAHVMLGSHPKFCLAVPVSVSTDNIVIGALEVKDDHREIETLLSARNSAGTWIPQDRARKVIVNRVSDGDVEITTQDALLPGQYVLSGSVTSATGTYDFGVQ